MTASASEPGFGAHGVTSETDAERRAIPETRFGTAEASETKHRASRRLLCGGWNKNQ